TWWRTARRRKSSSTRARSTRRITLPARSVERLTSLRRCRGRPGFCGSGLGPRLLPTPPCGGGDSRAGDFGKAFGELLFLLWPRMPLQRPRQSTAVEIDRGGPVARAAIATRPTDPVDRGLEVVSERLEHRSQAGFLFRRRHP